MHFVDFFYSETADFFRHFAFHERVGALMPIKAEEVHIG
jgi:hypothetical protein